MPRTTDGEFELVLGNKQLLSLFFLVVVLFAVFFSLGYMVGRSVGPGQTLAAQPPPLADPSPAQREPSPSPVVEPPRTQPPSDAAAETAAASQTQPARSEATVPAARSTEEAAASEPAPAMIARELHLQLAAVRVREDAEALAESLRKKGYQVLLNSQTRDGWHRVLIGPFSDERAAKEMKAKLEQDGFKSILKRP